MIRTYITRFNIKKNFKKFVKYLRKPIAARCLVADDTDNKHKCRLRDLCPAVIPTHQGIGKKWPLMQERKRGRRLPKDYC